MSDHFLCFWTNLRVGFYKDCEQGVTLMQIFLKSDTLFSRGPDFTRIANRGSP